MKTWFGMNPHVTDIFINWAEISPEKLAIKLRKSYDSVVDAGFEDDLKFLMEVAYDSGVDDETDNNADEDI